MITHNLEVPEETAIARLVHGAWAKQPAWFYDRRVKCHGISSLFFPEGDSGDVMRAKRVCRGTLFEDDQPCPFLEECLEWALQTKEKRGVWGGCSERDRRKLLRARKAAAQQQQQPVKVIKVKRRFTAKKSTPKQGIKVKRRFTTKRPIALAS